MVQNVVTHALEILTDTLIGEAKNGKSKLRKRRIARTVCRLVLIGTVLQTVYFNNELCLGNIKINDVVANAFLASYTNGQMP